MIDLMIEFQKLKIGVLVLCVYGIVGFDNLEVVDVKKVLLVVVKQVCVIFVDVCLFDNVFYFDMLKLDGVCVDVMCGIDGVINFV